MPKISKRLKWYKSQIRKKQFLKISYSLKYARAIFLYQTLGIMPKHSNQKERIHYSWKKKSIKPYAVKVKRIHTTHSEKSLMRYITGKQDAEKFKQAFKRKQTNGPKT